MLLHTTNDDQLINWWKKWIDFVKTKFHSNQNIEYDIANTLNWIQIHSFQFELKWIEFQFH